MTQMMIARVAGKHIARAMGYTTVPVLVAPMIGPVLAGAILTYAGWRWLFFINVPIGVVGLVLASVLLPDDGPAPQPRAFDAVGFALVSPGLVCLLYGFEQVTTPAARVGEPAAGACYDGAMRLVAAAVAVALCACSQILGLTAPRAQADAPPADSDAADAGAAPFTVAVASPAPRVPQNGSDFLAVTVTRDAGFSGAITVDIPSLASGVTVTPATIDSGATTGTLVVAGSAGLTVGDMLPLELVATSGDLRATFDFEAIVTLQPGILDPTFGTVGGGIVVPNFGSDQHFGDCNDIVINPNGSITAASAASNSAFQDVAIIFRLTADGQSDPSFDVGPVIAGSANALFAIARQSNGDVVAGGNDNDPGNGLAGAAWLASFTTDGSAPLFFGDGTDNDFVDSSQGYAIGSAVVVSVAALPDDTLTEVLGLTTSGGGGVLVRQAANGTSTGEPFAPVSLGVTPFELPGTMAIDAGSGTTTYVFGVQGTGSASTAAIVHVLADGAFDAGFGSNGVVTLGFNPEQGAIAVQPDGDVLVGAAVFSGGDSTIVERLQPDGTPDPTFGSGGTVSLVGLVGSDALTGVSAIAVQADHRIVLVAQHLGTGVSPTLIRLLPDGALDPTYGRGGLVSIPAFVLVPSMRLQASGDAVLCATAGGVIALGRVTF